MIVRRSINKDELKELPKTVFPGRIHVIQSEAETEKAVAYLQSQPILGIDSETRPSFTKGQSHKVALLQISSDECCFLFRLNMTGLTQPLVDLLENPAVIKVGLSLKDDFMMLHKRAPFTQQSCIELQDYVRQFGIQDKSLQKIYAILFKEKISKSQRLSNWEADVLSDGQKQYAATDAWACLNIYNLLQELKEKEGLTYLFISHNLSVVRYISDRIGVMYLGNMVEVAPTDVIFNDPRHPYTIALLSSIPTTDPDSLTKERIILEGNIPSPINPPSGCKFHTRCFMACDKCKVVPPPLTEVEPGHFVACHFADTKKVGENGNYLFDVKKTTNAR